MKLLDLSSAEDCTLKPPAGLGWELWRHQLPALEYMTRARRIIIGDEVGVGKTPVPLAAAQLLKAFPILIVPPAYLRYKWKRDCERWLPGTSIRTVEPNEPLMLPGKPEDPDVYIISYNLVAQHLDAIKRKPIRTFVADESHYLKNKKALRTKACISAARGVPLRALLSGTSVEQEPRDLLAQLEVLGQVRDVFGSAWFFLQRYCNAWGENEEAKCLKCLGKGCRKCRHTGKGFQKWDFSGARNLEELNRVLRSTCYVQRDKAQVHKSLPPLTSARVDVEINNRIDYNMADQDFIGWLRGIGTELAAESLSVEALARANKLRQLAATGKRTAAVEWIDGFHQGNPGHKLVIFTYYRETAAYFAERYSAPMIIGGVPMQRRDEMIQEFQASPDCKNIVLSVEAGGVGIDLFAASNCVFVELDWLSSTHIQAAGRLHRPGQTHPVTAWYLVARNTVEEQLLADHAEQEHVVNAALRGQAVRNMTPAAPRTPLRRLLEQLAPPPAA